MEFLMRIATALLCTMCLGPVVYGGVEDNTWEIASTRMLTSTEAVNTFIDDWARGTLDKESLTDKAAPETGTMAPTGGHDNLGFSGSSETLLGFGGELNDNPETPLRPHSGQVDPLDPERDWLAPQKKVNRAAIVRALRARPSEDTPVQQNTLAQGPPITDLITNFADTMLPYVSRNWTDRLQGYAHPLESIQAVMSMVRPRRYQPFSSGRSITTQPSDAYDWLYHFLKENNAALMPLREALTLLPNDPSERKKLAQSKRFKGFVHDLSNLVTLPYQEVSGLAQRANRETRHVFYAGLAVQSARAYTKLCTGKTKGVAQRRGDATGLLLQGGIQRLLTQALRKECQDFTVCDRPSQFIKANAVVHEAFGQASCTPVKTMLSTYENEGWSTGERIEVRGAISTQTLYNALNSAFGSPSAVEKGLKRWPMWTKHDKAYATRHNGPARIAYVGGETYAQQALRTHGYLQ